MNRPSFGDEGEEVKKQVLSIYTNLCNNVR